MSHTMTPIEPEPPWLALYRAETERLRVLIDLFHDENLNIESAFGQEICTLILDVAGRSSVKDFVPARLSREHVA